MNYSRMTKSQLVQELAKAQARREEDPLAPHAPELEPVMAQAIISAATQIAIIATDQEGIITLFNTGAEKMLGYEAREMVGRQSPLALHLAPEVEERARELSLLLGEPVEGFQAFVALAQRQGFEEREWTYVRKDGVQLSVNLVVTMVNDDAGQLVGYLGIAKNVSARRQAESDLRAARDELERKVLQRTEDLRELNQSLEEEVRQRRQAQASLRQREADFRALIDNLSVGIYRSSMGPASRILQANPAMATMFGFDSPQEMEGLSPGQLYQDPEGREELIRQLRGFGSVHNFELQLRKKDGTPFWASCTANVVPGEKEGCDKIEGVLQDISRRKLAEAQLRSSEERFRNLSHNSPDVIYTLDLDGSFSYVNPAWQKIMGHRPEEVLGRFFIDFARPQDQREFVRIFKEIRDRKETVHHTGILLHKDGSMRIVALSGGPNLDREGRVIGSVGIFKDITQASKTQEALKESEERHRAALEGSPDPVLICDLSGQITYLNPAFTLVFGWRREDLLGRSIDLEPGSGPSDAPRLSDLVLGQDPQGKQDTQLYAKGGRLVDVSISTARYRPPSSPEEGVIITLRDITERKRAETELRRNQASLARAQKMAHLGNWEYYPATGQVICSEEVYNIYGLEPSPGSESPVTLEQVFQSVHSEDLEMVRKTLRRVLELPQGSLDLEHRIVRPGGGQRIVHQLAEVVRDPQGNLLALVGAVQDITKRRESEEQMRLLARIFENTIEGILVTDAQGVIQMVNHAFTAITGFGEDEAVGHKPNILNSQRQGPQFYQRMWKQLLRNGHWQGEIWNRRKNGEAFPEWLTITALKDSQGNTSHYVGVFHDITESKRSEERITYQAYHDALTGLPNRLLFNDRLSMAIARAHRKSIGLAVLFLDLDNFKNINDSMGHAMGDLLLQSVAKRLVRWVREEDTVARLGGDEFIMLLQTAGDVDFAVYVAQRIQESLAQPFRLKGQEFYITASIGITIYPHDGRDAETLVSNADLAMYRAKDEGRNNYKLFTPAMNARVVRRMSLERNLRKALDRGEFLLHYQPKVDLRTERVTGLEALVRWLRPELGLVSPDEFIPLAEETGIIVPLGEWVLGEACARTKAWHQAGFTDLQVAVNLSPRQFQQPNLVQMVEATLARTGLSPSCLELEITENVVMSSVEEAIETLLELSHLGVQLSMDDFGRGYSSLYYLKRFPMNTLKIDRSFVADIASDSEDASIVNTIISMSRSLNLKVVAEGVETPEQVEFLRSLNCDQMQGYFYSRPVPPELVPALLMKRK